MPQNKFAIARYNIIHDLLQRNTYVKSNVIADICREHLGYEVTQRTIQMDLQSMKNDSFLGFFAPIEYCSKRKAYFYNDPEYQLSLRQLNPDEISLLENVCAIASNHLGSDQRDQLKTLLFKIKKSCVAK